ncbi:amid-like NADH oxidoreductase [Rhodotorula toruloides]|uniref:Amid-like NADH oxidoreductase n=1 Tax=Rhodotorula toruloides TaxID=5286 RepID=A0A511KLK5_RHOTO|nr:amid-like NADH oxidoreductase [Rhodotorula toruloides]
MLPPPHVIVQAEALSLLPSNRILLDRPTSLPSSPSSPSTEIPYEALILATGTKLSPPGTMPGLGTKQEGVRYLRGSQVRLREAKRVVIVGGGAVGVQMACDLAVLYPFPQKHITLIQSRHLMPRFHPALHDLVIRRFEELGIQTVLGTRAEVPEGGWEGVNESGKGGSVKSTDGRTVEADYVIHALGQTPNSSVLSTLSPSSILPSGYIRVSPSLLVSPSSASEAAALDGKVFALGDVADSGAPKAARPALEQARIVARNVVKALEGQGVESFETYTPSPAAIHLTLGIRESVIFRNPPDVGGEPTMIWKDDGREDMGIRGVWERRLPGFAKRDKDYHL